MTAVEETEGFTRLAREKTSLARRETADGPRVPLAVAHRPGGFHCAADDRLPGAFIHELQPPPSGEHQVHRTGQLRPDVERAAEQRGRRPVARRHGQICAHVGPGDDLRGARSGAAAQPEASRGQARVSDAVLHAGSDPARGKHDRVAGIPERQHGLAGTDPARLGASRTGLVLRSGLGAPGARSSRHLGRREHDADLPGRPAGRADGAV